ncbi:MAG: Fic family protein, partial [Planctomycetota bacterium]
LDDQQPIETPERERYIVSSLMEEAIASSKIEGASTLHRVAKDMLRRKREARDRHERMIVNNYLAILHIREHRGTPLTPEFIIGLQRQLTEGTLEKPDECGRLRRPDEDVVVADTEGNILHEPPHASTLDERLKSLCDFANATREAGDPFIHPLVRAAIVHFQLAYDHPFCDGNGRTARVLFYWVMLHAGYWMFEFLPISRLIYESPGEYQKAFQYVETDEFDLTYFLVYSTRLIARARKDLAQYIARKRAEQRRARETFDREGLNDRQRQILLDLMESPEQEFTIEAHQTTWDISYYTARSDLLHLENLGYLDRRKVGKKFVFTPSANPPE